MSVDTLAGHETRPVYFDPDLRSWVVSDYQSAREVLIGAGWSSDPMSSAAAREALAHIGIDDSPFGRSMLMIDPPDHTRLRDSVRDVFTPGYIEQLHDGVDAIAADTIDPIPADVEFDLMAEIALPLPVAVISEWLAIDVRVAQILMNEAGELVRVLDGVVAPDAALPATAPFAALLSEFLPLASERRNEPGDDLLSLIASDPALSLDEAVVNAILLAIAGHETTASLLGASMIRLLHESAGHRLIDRIDITDPAVIDELLRLDGPAQAVGRAALEPTELQGNRIEAGDRLLVMLAAANRDPDAFDDPDEFRLDRIGAPPHLALGYGRHRCLGAALARLETAIALRRIAFRKPRLVGTPGWRDTAILRAPTHVPVVFTEGARP
ncbi:cytochrome P450 [Jongsikchunia kroppenstedtii]|uniref:cytochrome P450 n=1 Tax=Jongsikchunia kroppenstedtii TaxID=1121721 RepID=UPI00035D6945|nr:cytochrome P450 [Jongsikchunia kroppenstedtii]